MVIHITQFKKIGGKKGYKETISKFHRVEIFLNVINNCIKN